MPAPTILLTGEIAPTLPDEIHAIVPAASVRHFSAQAELEAEIPEADIVFATALSESAVRSARRLRWVQSSAAGPDQMLTPAMIDSDIVVTSARGNGAIPLAEHAMLLMLALDRDLPRALRAQSEHRWDRFFHGELNAKTIGIIGTGHSGIDLAEKARAFHMRVLGMRRSAVPTPGFDAMYGREALPEFLAACDFLVVTAPLTPETQGMLGPAEFAAMKPGARYICFSRGGIADDAALLAALRSGHLGGAGLDAHAIEPLPPESPFWDLPNVIITPHHGAVTPQTRRRGWDIFIDNLARWQKGEPLRNIVDKAIGY